MKTASSAGKGDPYWYEWTLGLLKVVEMLHPESCIQSVSFQVCGVKGWDDVVVRYSDGRCDYFQIKHTRIGDNITFGDLVGVDKQGASLLGDLYGAWKAMDLKPDVEKVILFTNREAGSSAGRSGAGVHRPPLQEFATWLSKELLRVKSIGGCRPPKEWKAAWKEWLAQLTPGTSSQQLAFLRSFEIRANQDGLQESEDSVLQALSKAFQISLTQAKPFFHALDNALRRWTTTKAQVTVEDALTVMALDDEVEVEHRAPPPPAPFFPSRETALSSVRDALQAVPGSPIVFLCAEPGAGKTSLVSQLVNCRVPEALQGIIGLRYFAFRPITPESPLIPPDADHFVRPDRLWFSFLSQLRRGLNGKLRAYNVPLRNDLLDWPEARKHVLRLADRLGREMAHPFVIAIDGIDHAARAMRVDTTQAKDFFASLPGPDELNGLQIRLLLAGQPPESYPEYTSWLRATHPKVCKVGIGRLDLPDICILLRDKKCPIPPEHENAAARSIAEITQGNTLAVVFAAEEARVCNTVGELQDRLSNRHLGDGLQRYYGSIWEHALARIANSPVGMDAALAAALSLTAERLGGTLMASAFASLGLKGEQWNTLLAELGPLVVSEPDGFRVLHNDVRVFLQGVLSSKPGAVRLQGASGLANHYMLPSSNRWFAHKSLCRLLRDAGREVDWARVFTVDWVFEAAALGIPYIEMSDDCAAALHQGAILQDWNVMQELACATETLERWAERCEISHIEPSCKPAELSPAFLHSEAFVRPLADWHLSDLQNLVNDGELLVSSGEHLRARALVERWLTGLSIADLCSAIAKSTNSLMSRPPGGLRQNMGESQALESLGALCRTVDFQLSSCKPKKGVEQEAEAAYEGGWVQASCRLGPFDSLNSCFCRRSIKYFINFERALQSLASQNQWKLVRDLMSKLQTSRSRLDPGFRSRAAWWALKSDAAVDDSGWLDVLSSPRYGIPINHEERLSGALMICRALGWRDAATDPSAIADRVFNVLKSDMRNPEDYTHYRLLFRATATMSQASSVLQRRGAEAASDILPASQMSELVTALWNYPFKGINAHQDGGIAGQLAAEYVNLAFQLRADHLEALLDAAKLFIENYPVDSKRESLWNLHQRAGKIPELRTWLKQWLAEDGRLWVGDAGIRESIAEDLLPLARELGEHELAARAEQRLRWVQITYRGHKEYAFDMPVLWFKELAKNEPNSWRDEGLKLWTLNEACTALGGDDRSDWQLGEVLGAAAWACGPADTFRLLMAEHADCGTEKWFFPAAHRVIAGLTRHLCLHPDWAICDKLASWCLAVGFSRWFDDGSIKALGQLRAAVIESEGSSSEQAQIADAIRRLTPGEALRTPQPDSRSPTSTAAESEGKDIQQWIENIEKGEEINPRVAAQLLSSILTARPDEFKVLAGMVLEAVGVGAPYSWGWYTSNSEDALFEISRLVSDELMWRLVGAAVKYAGVGRSWTYGVSHNLQQILLARASRQGAKELRSGLGCLLQMHERWARGGSLDLTMEEIRLPPAEAIATYTELAARSLVFLLASRSAEVIESALVGIHSLVMHDRKAISELLELTAGDPWKQQWILNSAEVWATLYPGELKSNSPMLEMYMASGPLHRRLQVWIVLSRVAQSLGEHPPVFPHVKPTDKGEGECILKPARHIMASTPIKRGSILFVNCSQTCESTIRRVQSVTGADLVEVRSEVAMKLLESSPEDLDTMAWPVRIRCSGDTQITSFLSESILDEAFDKCLGQNPLPKELQIPFTQAYLSNEDPWILRNSPLPDMDPTAWPSEEEVGGTTGTTPNPTMIRQKLHLLATQHGISSDELAIAARVQVFSWREDCIYCLWWEESAEDAGQVDARGCPRTLSGRTYVFGFQDWWEPELDREKCPLMFAVGGQQRLSLSFPQFFPARLWASKFKWCPSPYNPLIWLEDGKPVARYERIHGTLRNLSSGYPRQPLLDRWVVKKAAWEKLGHEHGPFKQNEDFQVFKSDVEK